MGEVAREDVEPFGGMAIAAGVAGALEVSPMRDAWLKVLHTSGATVVAIGASAVTLMVTARTLGPAGRGLYAATTAWVTLFATFGSLSLGPVILHEVAGRSPDEWLGEIVGTSLAIVAGVSLVGWAAVSILYAAAGSATFTHLSPALLVVGFAALPLLIGVDILRYILNAVDALRIANYAQACGGAASVAAVLLLTAVFRFGVAGALVAPLAAAGLATAIGARYLARRQGRWAPNRIVARRLLKGSAGLHLTAVGNYVYAQGSVLVLNHYRPPSETAYYQFAMQLFGMALTMSAAVSTVSFGLVAQKGPDGAWPEQRRLIAQSTALTAAIAIVAYFAAPVAIRLMAGDAFLPAVALFRIALPALFGAGFATTMASQWIGRGLFVQSTVLTIAISALSLLLDLHFVPLYGMRGALVSTLVTYGISVFGNGAMALWVQAQWKRSLATPGKMMRAAS